MIVVNGLTDTPRMQRYQFNGQAKMEGNATLSYFLYTKLSTQLTADKQNVLIYGIKQNKTLADHIQIRNANNLKDITLDIKYFDQIDTVDVQSYTLHNNNLYAAIIQTEVESNTTYFMNISNQPYSGGKLSTTDTE